MSRYCKIFFFLPAILANINGFAQEDTVAHGSDTVTVSTDTLSSSAYELALPEKTTTIYNMHFSTVMFTLLIIGIVYISYRYWKDNMQKPNTTDNIKDSIDS